MHPRQHHTLPIQIWMRMLYSPPYKVFMWVSISTQPGHPTAEGGIVPKSLTWGRAGSLRHQGRHVWRLLLVQILLGADAPHGSSGDYHYWWQVMSESKVVYCCGCGLTHKPPTGETCAYTRSPGVTTRNAVKKANMSAEESPAVKEALSKVELSQQELELIGQLKTLQ